MAERLQLELRRAEFELVTPLYSARGRWQRRTVLELSIPGARGAVGRGEAAPLPGYSPDELEAVESALRALARDERIAAAGGESCGEVVQLVEALLPAALPAARFGLQTALLDRLAQSQQRPLWRVLHELLPGSDATARAIPLSGLLASSEPEQALAQAEQHYALGLRCFKIKIGPGRLLPGQAQLLAGLRARWGTSVTLRLDANGSLATGELAATALDLARFAPELVEEPLPEPRPELMASLPFDWALDESLQGMPEPRVAALCALPRCRALVLKLTALGGFGAAAALAGCARRSGKLAIVSHALEGELGWLASAHFALALASSVPAGLWPPASSWSSVPFAAGALLPPQAAGLGAAR